MAFLRLLAGGRRGACRRRACRRRACRRLDAAWGWRRAGRPRRRRGGGRYRRPGWRRRWSRPRACWLDGWRPRARVSSHRASQDGDGDSAGTRGGRDVCTGDSTPSASVAAANHLGGRQRPRGVGAIRGDAVQLIVEIWHSSPPVTVTGTKRGGGVAQEGSEGRAAPRESGLDCPDGSASLDRDLGYRAITEVIQNHCPALLGRQLPQGIDERYAIGARSVGG